MNDIIKEKQLNEVLYGLDYIGNKIKNDDGKLELGVNNCKLLLDYITNLQIKNKELEQIIDIRECQLEEMEINKTDYTQVNILEMQLEDYKARNIKAIEYIEKYKEPLHHYFDEPDCDYWIATNPDDLLDILRGEE